MRSYGVAIGSMVLTWMVSGGLFAGIPGSAATVHPSRARIGFSGTSTLHGFAGTADSREVVVRLAPAVDGQESRWDASATVAIESLDTANAKRDANMRRLLQAAESPVMRGVITQAVVPKEAEATVDLELRIRDCTRVIPAQVSAWRETPHGPAFQLRFEVSLAAFGLKPPAVAGFIRVGDLVKVTCDVTPDTATVTQAGHT